MKRLIAAILVCLCYQTAGAFAAPRSLVEMTGFSFYLGCDPATPACWVHFTPGTFYNALNVGANAKPVVIRDDFAEMNIVTGGFTPQTTGVYETRMLMEGTNTTGTQSLMSCGWSTTPATFPPYSIVMIETQGPYLFENSHMVALIVSLTGGTTYYMTCWASNPWLFNNLTVQPGASTPIPIVDFIINRID